MAHFFRRLDGTHQVSLAHGPHCPGGVFPEPRIDFPTVGSSDVMVLTYDEEEGREVPGEEVSTIAGIRFSHGRVSVRLPVVDQELLDDITVFRDEAEPFVWSPDDGSTLIVVELVPGVSLVATPARHKPGWFTGVECQLRTIDRLTGSGSGS